MEAASSSQYFCTNLSAVLEINTCQFLEELMVLVLGCQQIDYSPVLTYQTQLGFRNMPAIVSTILDSFEIMSRRYETHIYEVVCGLSKNSKTGEYFELVGRRLLIDRPFEWKYFRVFLAFVSKMSDLCYKHQLVFLSDDIVVTAARFIEKNIQSRIDELNGWKNFEEDCVKICLMRRQNREKEKVEKPPKPQNISVCSEMPSTSRKLVEIHTCNFNNETFGKCFVYESPEESYTEPIVYLVEEDPASGGFKNVRPDALKQAHQMQMTTLVIEVMRISMRALSEISSEMEAGVIS